MIHDNDISNRSGNRPFEDVLRASLSRRNLLARSAALGVTGFLGALAGNSVLSGAAVAATKQTGNAPAASNGGMAIARGQSLINFPVLPYGQATGPRPALSDAYQYEVLIPWGTPLKSGVPEYAGNPNTRPTSAQQAQQVGIGHDGMWFFPMKPGQGNSNTHGVLCINHEFGGNTHVLGKASPTSLEDVRVSQHAHGVAVVELRKSSAGWGVVPDSALSRRIHVNTDVSFSGPAANSAVLKTIANNPTRGTANNCASGYTPWGTYLTCEENFNGYFGAKGSWTATEAQRRYGFSANGFGYGWHLYDDRFDLSNPNYANEENRFGWVVEIDPMNPDQTPVKRTALGRFKHENAEIVVGRGGRVVAYMGDDETFDYIYKFVSEDNWQSMRARGLSPLDHGKLYVARFNEDGTGDWLELTINDPRLKAKFKDQSEVLTYARIAGDLVGATPMDRPEWIAAAPTGEIYCTLTNNSRRGTSGFPGTDAANPITRNSFGHIIKWRDRDQNVGTTFTWDIFVLARDTHQDANGIYPSAFGSPDGLWADKDGRLFIQTDGTQPTLNGVLVGNQKVDGVRANDQLLVADPTTGEIRRMLSGVTSCEITGITVTPDRRTLFVNIQHPGDGNPALTNFPAPQGTGLIPRDCTLVITRKDGGIVGS